MTRQVLIDSTVPLYALGTESSWRQPCLSVLSMLASSRLIGLASTEMIQEFVHHRLRRTLDRTRCVSDARNLTELVRVVPFDHTVLTSALDLIERTGIRGRDAVHVATALTQGVTHIISTDSDFDNIPGLTRLDPMNAA